MCTHNRNDARKHLLTNYNGKTVDEGARNTHSLTDSLSHQNVREASKERHTQTRKKISSK